MTTVSFPGLGIGEFTMDKVAVSFSLFGRGIEIRWYGLLITIGIILALIYSAWRATKYEKIVLDDLLDIAIFTIPLAIIGARIYYVLTYGISNFVVKSNGKIKLWDTFVGIIGIWNGGLAIYGAIIAGALTIYFVCRHKKIKFTQAFDAISPAVMIGQTLGRWGNFVNGEAYGYEVKSNSLLYFMRMGLLPNEKSISQIYYFHPTFLYESLWNLVGFLIINSFYKKKKFDGQIFLMYITWYGFGRMFIEGLRTDSLYIGVFRISQVIGFCCFIAGVALLFIGFRRAKRAAYEAADYEPVYKNFAHHSITSVKEVGHNDTPNADKPVDDEIVTPADEDDNSSKNEINNDVDDTSEDENGKNN